jgi:hypothetical protein
MDLDIDLSGLGLRSSKERTLGALKKRAEAAATPARPVGPPAGAGLGTPFPVGPGHHAPLPPLPQSSLSAGLDALAGFGSPLPASLRPTQQPAAAPATTPGLTRGASVEDLLGDFMTTPPLPRCAPRHERAFARRAATSSMLQRRAAARRHRAHAWRNAPARRFRAASFRRGATRITLRCQRLQQRPDALRCALVCVLRLLPRCASLALAPFLQPGAASAAAPRRR